MKHGILKTFKGIEFEKVNIVKESRKEIEKHLILFSMKYKGKENIREYITKKSHLDSKLKALRAV